MAETAWQLVLYEGETKQQVIPLEGETITIGRELYNDIPLDDTYVSKRHAQLRWEADQLVIEDLQSINGTLVNDQPLTGPLPLQAGDVITIEPFTFRLEEAARPQSRIPTQVHQTARPGWSWWPVAGLVALLLFLVAGIIGAGWFFSRSQSTPTAVAVVEEATAPPTGAATVPVVVPEISLNRIPPNNSQVLLDEPVLVEATASDENGIARLELWANRRKVDQVESQLAEPASSMTAVLEWRPDRFGPYTLEVRAYNEAGLANELEVVRLVVVAPSPVPTETPSPTLTPSATPSPTVTPPPPTATPTPTATFTPLPPTPTPGPPSLTAQVDDLNVRAGPGPQYDQVGRLAAGQQAEIVGQANIGFGQWWQIRLAGEVGWVLAEPGFVVASNTETVPVVAAPPVPTPTITPTPTPTTGPPMLRAPRFQTLLIVSNRSLNGSPALLTLSGGRSVGGGREIHVDAGSEEQLVLEPDDYRALWSSPVRGGFVRGADFTAVMGKIIVMWIVPEEGRTGTEMYDELPANR